MQDDKYGGYGRNAENFDSGPDDHSPWVWEWLKEHLAMPAEQARVLDLACGTGISTRRLKKCGFRNVIGADADPSMITVARRHNDGIPYHIEPADHMRFSDGMFDAVTIRAGFRHFRHVYGTIKEIRRVLRDDGVLLVVDWAVKGLGEKRREVLMRFIEGPVTLLPETEISSAYFLLCGGFRDVKTCMEHVTLKYTMSEAYRYMHKSALLARVPPEKLVEAKVALYDLCESLQDKNGLVHRSIDVVADIGRK